MTQNDERSITPFYPVVDESLHGYILRLLLLTQANNLSSVINSRDGNWANLLRIPPQIRRYVNSVKRYDLFNTIKNSFPSSSFYIPIEDIQETYQELFWDGETYSQEKDMPIHFCKECFKEQLAKLGFTYFLHYWSFQKFCPKHNIHLSRLAPTTPVKSRRYIRQVLALSFNENTTPADSRKSRVNDSENSNTEIVFAPALINSRKDRFGRIRYSLMDIQKLSTIKIALEEKLT